MPLVMTPQNINKSHVTYERHRYRVLSVLALATPGLCGADLAAETTHHNKYFTP